MTWSKKRKPDLVDDLDLLITDLCVQWGFCNHLRADDLVQDDASLTAEAFAYAVLEAEGMNGELEPGWLRRIRNKFTERYGASVSKDSHAAQSGSIR